MSSRGCCARRLRKPKLNNIASHHHRIGSPDDQLSIRPHKAVKSVGETAQILCVWKNEPLMQCIFKIPELRKISLTGVNHNNDSITYYGDGLQKGECGMNMIVEEKHHGTITCELTSVSGQFMEASMNLTVAKTPKDPVLRLDAPTYLEGGKVTATCVVAEGRPAADVTWAFDGQDDFNNMMKQQHKRVEEPVGTTVSVSESGTWTVTADDDQKQVTCVADHYSWKKQGPKVARMNITVHYQPRIYKDNEVQNDMLYPNLMLGEQADLTIQVKANPEPTGVQITVDNKTLTVGEDGDEKYQISKLEQQNGFHMYSLVIRNLTAEDLQQVCLFNVTNLVGSSAARLTFSVRPQVLPDGKPEDPKGRAVAGSTLTGVIIGVSIIIIITIALVMFAKFNKKWCFASKPPVYTGQLVPSE